MKFEGKLEGTPSNSASNLSDVKKFEGKREGIPSKFPANTTNTTNKTYTTYMSRVFSEESFLCKNCFCDTLNLRKVSINEIRQRQIGSSFKALFGN